MCSFGRQWQRRGYEARGALARIDRLTHNQPREARGVSTVAAPERGSQCRTELFILETIRLTSAQRQ